MASRNMINTMLILSSVLEIENDYNTVTTVRRESKPKPKLIPKGHKVWPEYGGVTALNEKNAIRKYKKLKK